MCEFVINNGDDDYGDDIKEYFNRFGITLACAALSKSIPERYFGYHSY